MYCVYILISIKDSRLYIGRTDHLRERILQHHAGQVTSTRNRRPLKLVYYEAYTDREDSKRREKGLKKSGSVYMGLVKRISASLQKGERVAGGCSEMAITKVSKTFIQGSNPCAPATRSTSGAGLHPVARE